MSQNEFPTHASMIALEVARILRESGALISAEDRAEWLDIEQAAGILGYSASRLYHIYDQLGLVPSRTSKRRLRFRRRDVEQLLARYQARQASKPRRTRSLIPVVGGNKSTAAPV